MSLFQNTSLTFGQAKTLVAQQGSKLTAEFLTRAGQSLQQAVKYWNRFNWKWRLKQAADYSISASASTITLPFDFKDVYTARWEGTNPHYLRAITRRDFDRQWFNQAQPGFTMAYDLFQEGNEGKLALIPHSNQAGTLVLKYYRRMTVPCSVSATCAFSAASNTISSTALAGVTLGSQIYDTGGAAGFIQLGTTVSAITPDPSGFVPGVIVTLSQPTVASATGQALTVGGDNAVLDVPEDYENGILAWATAHYLSALGAPAGRLSYFISLANDELEEAKRANEMREDHDVAFEPCEEIPLNLINPNATTL